VVNYLNQRKESLNDLFEKGHEFLKDIKPDEKVALVHHTDLDGLSSATLIKIGLERLGVKLFRIVSATYRNLEEVVCNLECDKIIIVDIGMKVEFCESFTKPTLYIDHHQPRDCVQNEKILFINPGLVNLELYQPASYIVYKFLSGIVDLKDKEWISVLGIVGDYGFEDCMDILGKWTDAKTRDELLDETDLGKTSIAISNSIFILGLERIMEILLDEKDMESVAANMEIKKASNEYQKMYDKEMENFWNNREEVGKILFSILNPPYEGVGSGISSRVSRKNPEKIVFLFEDIGERYKINTRYQGKDLHLGKFMEKICGGGGHRCAAGGSIDKDDLDSFKERVKKELKVS